MILRLISLIRKEFIQIFRDPRTLIVIIVMPIAMLFLLGYAANTDVKNLPIAVWDQSRTPSSRALLDVFRSANYFTLAYSVDSQDEIRSLIEQDKVHAALIIPPDYDLRLSKDDAQVAMILDGSDATQVISGQTQLTGRSAAINPPLEVRPEVWYNPDLVSAYFMIPGLIGMILNFTTTLLTASTIVRERERATIEQLIVTPIRSWELVIGKIAPYVFLCLTNAAEVLLIGHFWFNVPIRSSLGLIIGTTCVLLLSSLGIGLLASTIANTQQEAFLTVLFTILPSVFLSGFFFPLEAMPPFLQWVSYLIPLRYFLIIIRSLMIKGVGIAPIQDEIIGLTVLGVAIMSLAAMRFHKRLD